jgi:hypothetical protein
MAAGTHCIPQHEDLEDVVVSVITALVLCIINAHIINAHVINSSSYSSI